MSTRRATITDVAREAGVSPSTASVVFSGKTAVSDATRQRVLDAAGALGYTGPDPRAASLRRGRSGIVGRRLRGAPRRRIPRPGQDAHDGRARPTAWRSARRRAPAAARSRLRCGTERRRSRPHRSTPRCWSAAAGCCANRSTVVTARGIPVVVIEGDAGEGVPRIGLDNREAQRQAASHLRVLGHTRGRDRHAARPRRDGSAAGSPRTSRSRSMSRASGCAGAREVFPDAAGLRRRGQLHRRRARRRTSDLRGPRRTARPPSSRRATCSRRASSARRRRPDCACPKTSA